MPLRNDIISGQDFLSLFITENPAEVATESSGQPTQRLSTPEATLDDTADDDRHPDDFDAFEGDIGNDIASSDGFAESPQTTTLIAATTTTTTTAEPPSTQPSRTSRSSSNKRVIVRKLVNVHLRNNGARNAIPTTTILPTPTTDGGTSGDSNYLEEAAERMPVNSQHRSESLFIEEADAKDLINSESMNVPRIAKLPAGSSSASMSIPLQQEPPSSSLVKTSSSSTSSSSSSTSSSSTSASSQLDANDGVRGGSSSSDNENLQRNLPFTLHRPVAASSNNDDDNKYTDADNDDDLESNASNNDQLVQERRMSTSRSRTQRKQIDTLDGESSAVPLPQPPPAPLSPYQTGVYGGGSDNSNANTRIRLPVPRSIAYGALAQRLKQQQESDRQRVLLAPPSAPLYQAKVYSEPAKVYSEPAKVYSEPAKVYSEPAKVYGQPEKIYSEPAKVYSEPAKVYSEPAKFYSEPAKVYSEPAKNYGVPPTPFPITTSTSTSTVASVAPPSTTHSNRKVLFNLDKLPYDLLNAPNRNLNLQSNQDNSQAVSNAGISKKAEEEQQQSDLSNRKEEELEAGREKSEAEKGDNNKVGYVVEGRTYRKYRVEEKTPDGFIVGEYGVVSHNDGNLRGVRYTADSNINPRLIYDALLKFLSL